MPVFTGRHQTTTTTRLDPARALATFLDLDIQIACRPEIARAEKLDETTVKVEIQEMKHGPVSFAGRYTMVWTREGDTARWRTTEGNTTILGEATFSPAPGGGSRIAYREEVSTDIPLGRLVARVARPVAELMMVKGMRGFLQRMVAAMDERA